MKISSDSIPGSIAIEESARAKVLRKKYGRSIRKIPRTSMELDQKVWGETVLEFWGQRANK